MRIWEERQVGKYGRKETKRAFHYFQMYLNQEGRRSVRRLHEELKKTAGKTVGKTAGKIPRFNTLVSYCRDFRWVERVNAYDDYLIERNRKNKELQLAKVYSDVADFSSKEISSSVSLVDYPKKVIGDALNLYNDDKIGLDEFNKYVVSASKTYKDLVGVVHGYDPTLSQNKGATLNNINQVGNRNSMSFQDLLERKVSVIDEVTDDEESRETG